MHLCIPDLECPSQPTPCGPLYMLRICCLPSKSRLKSPVACETFAPLSQGKRFPAQGRCGTCFLSPHSPCGHCLPTRLQTPPGQELLYSSPTNPLTQMLRTWHLAGRRSVCTRHQADLGEEGCHFWGQEAAGMESSARFHLGVQNWNLGDSSLRPSLW